MARRLEPGEGQSGNFFRFEIQDTTVLVHFQPAARQRLGDWTTVSWADWYRR